jgi:GNAT superfamily N-acetyltransferase
MCDEWMPPIRLPLTPEQFHQLPRNSAYRYEYFDGQAHLSPRPKHFHCLLELQPWSEACGQPADQGPQLRRVGGDDFAGLEPVFAAAFHRTQPFGSLSDEGRAEAARACLERTRTGQDGPWVERASFLAVAGDKGQPIGAILITLLPLGDPCDWDSYRWAEPPPPDCIERRLGRPHLTWIFVSPLYGGQGVGTALLAAAVRELLDMGYSHLLSTFLLGNDSSTLWHWRAGFELLAYPGSWRRMRQALRKRLDHRAIGKGKGQEKKARKKRKK